MKKLALSSGKIADYLRLNEREAKELYHRKGLTARQLATHFNILFTPAFQKQCYEILGSKNMGRGGARFGAGHYSEEKKPKKVKKTNIFVFDFSDEISRIIKENIKPKGEFNTYKAFVEETIYWYNRQTLKEEDTGLVNT